MQTLPGSTTRIDAPATGGGGGSSIAPVIGAPASIISTMLADGSVTDAKIASTGTIGTYVHTVTVVTPTGDAATDTAALQAALTAMSGVGEVHLKPGTYAINAPITVPSNSKIVGCQGAILDASLTTTGGQTQVIFYAALPSPIGHGTISTTPTRTNSVAVNGWSGTAPAAGQVLGLFHGQTLHTYDIKSVSGTGPYTLTLDRAIAHPFVSTDTANVYASQPTNIRILGHGLRFRGVADRYIEFGALNGGYIEDCHFDAVTGNPTAGNGCASFDTGSRNVGFSRCTTDLRGVSLSSVFGLGLESVDGGFAENCRAIGGDVGIYVPDCHATFIRGCWLFGIGKSTGTGSGILLGAAVGGLGTLGTGISDCEAIQCQNAYSIGATSPAIRGVTAIGCEVGLNVNSDSVSVEAVDLVVSNCTQIAVLAAATTIHGLRATALAGAPAYGLIACTGGTSRIYDAKIVSTATTFVAAAIKTTGTGSVEVYDTTITLADASNAYGIYGTVGTVQVRNLTVNGSATGGVRLDSGLSGVVGPDCDFSVASLPIYSGDGIAWKMLPTGVEQSISMADANKSATFAQSYSDILKCTGAITAARTLTMAFKVKGHIWTINNATTGGFAVNVSFGSGSSVACAAGITRVYWDGTNAVQA